MVIVQSESVSFAEHMLYHVLVLSDAHSSNTLPYYKWYVITGTKADSIHFLTSAPRLWPTDLHRGNEKLCWRQIRASQTREHHFRELWSNIHQRPSITSSPLCTHQLTHVPSAGDNSEPQMFSVSRQPETTGSQVTWSSSTEYVYALLELTFSICELSSGTQPIQKVISIIQHPNIEAKLFPEEVKSPQHWACCSRNCKGNQNYGNMIFTLPASASVNIILVVYRENMFFRFPFSRCLALSNIPITLSQYHTTLWHITQPFSYCRS